MKFERLNQIPINFNTLEVYFFCSSLQEVGIGSLGLEQRSLGLLDTGRQRELDLGVVHLLDKCSTSLACSNWLHTNNLNAVSSSTVTSSHIAIALGDSR